MSLRLPKRNQSQLTARLRLGLLPLLIMGALSEYAHGAAVDPANPASPAGASASVDFETDFFPKGTAPKVDLSRFEKGNYVVPGTYRGDVIVNQKWRARTDIVMGTAPGTQDTVPCFSAAQLVSYGIDLKKLAADPQHAPAKPLPEGQFCAPLGDYIPGATASFSGNDQVLTLSVPQIYTLRSAQGYVDPSQWDAGINAGVLNYNTNVYRSSYGGRDTTSAYAGINASLNLGSWHAYHLGAMTWSQNRGAHYQSNATYLQHDIPSWQAQVAIGDTYTAGDIFDSFRLRGARIYSDDRMLPQSQRGYAPVVRGVAETNARVRVKQNGYIIYETTVAPGPFVLDDLYPTGYGGDLDVEVTEADGRIKRFTVPYAAVPMLLRPGLSRWSIAAGEVSQLSLKNAPQFMQGTYQRGLTNVVTGYTGTILGADYQSVLLGAALNTGVGAFSADVTHARNRVPGQSATQGESLRLGYNKNITDIGTNLAVAAYRYSTPGYVSFNDAVNLRNVVAYGQNPYTVPLQRNRLDLNLNQTLGEGNGQLYATASRIDYWNRPGSQINYSVGYSNRFKSVNYSFSAQRSLDSIQNFVPGLAPVDAIPNAPHFNSSLANMRRDTTLFFTVSVPLGTSPRAPNVTAMLNRSKATGTTSQASVSGVTGQDNRLAYNATLGNDGSGTTVNLNSQYNSAVGNVGGGISRGDNYQQINTSASGSVIVHSGGVTFAPPTGDTIGLVHADGASGAQIQNGQSSVVDGRGYGVVPYLQPYLLNTVSLDPQGTDSGVELKEATRNVAPRAGAVVLLNYETAGGRALLVEVTLPDGRPVPFGADVLNEKGDHVGVAGQASRLFVRGVETSSMLTVRWGINEAESCQLHVELAPKTKGGHNDMETIHAGVCRPVQAGETPLASGTSRPATSDAASHSLTATSPSGYASGAANISQPDHTSGANYS